MFSSSQSLDCMSDPTQDQWNTALKAVLKKASRDPAFRAKTITDAATAFKEAAGLELPPQTKIRFVEKVEETVIALPPWKLIRMK